LSARAGIRKSRVRKHLEPSHFGSVSVEEISRYAKVFNIPPCDLLQVVLINTGDRFESHLFLENKAENLSVTHTSTGHPHVVLTKIEERKKE
jgi:hypothetical protein